MFNVCIIGAGLAGSELAYQLAKDQINVTIYEPRLSVDGFSNSVHTSKYMAELVCSNSLRSNSLHSAAGLLKQELRNSKSLLINRADKHAVPAGSALAVSRDDFSEDVTNVIKAISNIKIIDREVEDVDDLLEKYSIVVIATGPLTSRKLSDKISELIKSEYLYFYDAIAPIVEFSSINMDKCFWGSRYSDETKKEYINCPLTKEEYYNFIEEIINAEHVKLKEGDKDIFFSGCLPIERMADSGKDTLLHGPMRGDGLINYHNNGKFPYAAVQLRQDNTSATMFNMVGFQTRLVYSEQRRIFRTLPGLENVEFFRYGSMHRNTYVNAPMVLNSDMSLKVNNRIFLAGQISGVEGYIESIAHGIIVAHSIKARISNSEFKIPSETALGSLQNYLINADPLNFQPMKINFGIMPPLSLQDKHMYRTGRGRFENRKAISERSLSNTFWTF